MAINAVLNSLTGPGGQYSGASTSFGGQDGLAGMTRNRLTRRQDGQGEHPGPLWGRNRIDGW